MHRSRDDAGLLRWSTADEALPLIPALLASSWPQFLLTGFVAGVLGTAATFLVQPRFTAKASFVPVTSSGARLPANLTGIAAGFGISASGGAGIPPSVFSNLVETESVRKQVALATYQLPACVHPASAQGTLIDAYHLTGEARPKAIDAAIRSLKSATKVDYDALSQLVSLQTVSCSPDLAAAILQQYLDIVQRFSVQTLKSQATAAREFAESRSQELNSELSEAEDALTRFYEHNRTYPQSPLLLQEEARLKRKVGMLESTYLTVRSEYERARLDEARDLPAITVIEPPAPPGRKSWPVRWLVGMVAAVFSCGALLTFRLARLQRNP
jgi:uncharacterized protein involved in exopolysaccharide biosynthesis